MDEIQDEKILTQKQILVMLSEIASGQAKETIVVTTKVAELMTDPVTGKSVKVYNEILNLSNIQQRTAIGTKLWSY